ncbi:LD20211p [Strongyloides ratti]|uniref:LD20211p n=1 Tax=Strongyloides ratti TaxID=34506 RepID=A0A090KV75_STRRB|nr:LD20211p [Strongyloides ratti]CEF59740.1 LD20211p [Strongyloides ratti]
MKVIGLQYLSSKIYKKIADINEKESNYDKEEIEVRNNLACLYRIIDQMGLSQSVFNHLTARISKYKNEILINPFGLLYHEITASSLIKVDEKGDILDKGSTKYGINNAGYILHSAIHEYNNEIGCVIHLHVPDVVAVSSMTCGLLPICQESMIIGQVTYHDYEGIINSEKEKIKFVNDLGNKKVMLLRNHGFVCCGETIMEALFLTYHLIIACETQVKIMSMANYDHSKFIIPSVDAQNVTFQIASGGAGGVNFEGTKNNKCEKKWKRGELEWEAWIRILDDMNLETVKIILELKLKMADQSAKTKIAYVKQVLSGDSIILMGTGDNSTDMFVCLAYTKAPHLGKAPTESTSGTQDEPFAWECREFVRRRLVGRRVTFIREYIGSNGREFGQIIIGTENLDKCENISESATAAGLMEIKPVKQSNEFVEKLLALQEKAKSSKLGKWIDESEHHKHIRNIQWNIQNIQGFVQKYKGTSIKAIIENVRDGSSFRAYISQESAYITFVLSGIKCPALVKKEQYAEEAKLFVEARLLNREIDLIVEGVDNQRIVASIAHRAGNIAVLLLREGYAKCIDWSIGLVTGGAQAYRDAEKVAKERKINVWKDYEGGTISQSKGQTNGIVVEVGLGDNIMIENGSGNIVKYYFSSLRPPRMDTQKENNTSSKAFRALYDIPCMYMAREYLRRKLIGKSVKIVVDYIQPKSEQFPEKVCGTVYLDKENICELLVKKGFAKVIKHRRDDENRSSQYDTLLAAEKEAESAKVNLWADNANTMSMRVTELIGDYSRAKQFLPSLQRTTKHSGIIEFVTSGSRYRVFLPKENLVISMALSGITCPRAGRPGGSDNEPFGVEAINFAKKIALQHDVEVEIDAIDKTGGFIGQIFVLQKTGNINVAKSLIENGLAYVHSAIDKSRFANEFYAAEESAKKKKLNIWENYVDENKVVEVAPKENDNSERKQIFKRVVISYVDRATFKIYLQFYDHEKSLVDLMERLQICAKNSVSQILPKRGELCMAKDSQYGKWTRARIDGIRDNKANVFYIDYGNSEILNYNIDNIKPISAEDKALQQIAREVRLAFVNPPPMDEFGDLSFVALTDILYQEEYIYAALEYKVGKDDYVTLAIDDKKAGVKYDVGKKLVSDGYLVTVDDRHEPKFKAVLEEYLNAEQKARREHLNIWRYGDFTGNEI